MSGYGPSAGAEIGATPGSGLRPQASALGAPVLDEKPGRRADGEDTTMHWMSPSTRKTQYDKIDRANSGLRGLLRKMMPRCVAGGGPQSFYEEEKSDVGSVRRYRMDVPGEEDADAKSITALKMQRRKLERSTATHRGEDGKKMFGCF